MHTYVNYLTPSKKAQSPILLWRKYKKIHGTPNIIVSDRDPIFTGNFWIELFSCLGTQLNHSSSYHPQSDVQTKIINKFLEGYLRCFGADKQTNGSRGYPWKNGGIKLPSIHNKK